MQESTKITRRQATRRLFFGTASAAMLTSVATGDASPGDTALDEAGAITLRKGDVLVVHLSEDVTMKDDEIEDARNTVKEALGWPDVLISQGVDRMEVVRRA